MDSPQHFVFLLLPEFTHLAFSCAVEPLRIANLLAGRQLYRWTLISENGEDQVASNGISVRVDGPLEHSNLVDRLFVVSGFNVHRHVSSAVVDFLRREWRHGRRLGAICSGAYVLASAGLLDGRSCAIHWEFHEGFKEQFPNVDLRRSVFVSDEAIATASGGPAAADLMLHFIADAHGGKLASLIADQMVYSGVRCDTSEQIASISARFGSHNGYLAKAFHVMEANIEQPVNSDRLAREVGITIRQLQRLFRRFVGRSPHRIYLEIRLNKARALLLQTDMSVVEVAVACGFQSSSNFSRSYRELFGKAPREETANIPVSMPHVAPGNLCNSENSFPEVPRGP